jgi:hypothetical protein
MPPRRVNGSMFESLSKEGTSNDENGLIDRLENFRTSSQVPRRWVFSVSGTAKINKEWSLPCWDWSRESGAPQLYDRSTRFTPPDADNQIMRIAACMSSPNQRHRLKPVPFTIIQRDKALKYRSSRRSERCELFGSISSAFSSRVGGETRPPSDGGIHEGSTGEIVDPLADSLADQKAAVVRRAREVSPRWLCWPRARRGRSHSRIADRPRS